MQTPYPVLKGLSSRRGSNSQVQCGLGVAHGLLEQLKAAQGRGFRMITKKGLQPKVELAREVRVFKSLVTKRARAV